MQILKRINQNLFWNQTAGINDANEIANTINKLEININNTPNIIISKEMKDNC